MGVAFNRGHQLGPKDLNILLRTVKGILTDVYMLTYTIYRNTAGGSPVIILEDQPAIKERVGVYYAGFTVGETWDTGEHFISWKIVEYPGTDPSYREERFSVEDFCVQVAGPEYTPFERDLLKKLRHVLRDNNPERNYHFMPPQKKNRVKNFTEQFGFIWEDEELMDFIELAVDWVNLYPPATNFTLTELSNNKQKPWRIIVIIGAAVLAIEAVALNWIADEFGYSIGGVQLDLEKSAKYQAMRDTLEQQLNTMIEQAKATIKITKGLRQARFTTGYQSGYLGPGSAPGVMSIRNLVSRGFGVI